MGHGSRDQTAAALSARPARERRGCESTDHRRPEGARGRLPAGRLFARRPLPRGLSHGDVAGAVRTAPRRGEEEKPRGLAARHSDRRRVLIPLNAGATSVPPITSDVIEPSRQSTIFLIIRLDAPVTPPGKSRDQGESHASRIYEERSTKVAARYVEGDRRQDLRQGV